MYVCCSYSIICTSCTLHLFLLSLCFCVCMLSFVHAYAAIVCAVFACMSMLFFVCVCCIFVCALLSVYMLFLCALPFKCIKSVFTCMRYCLMAMSQTNNKLCLSQTQLKILSALNLSIYGYIELISTYALGS